MNREPVPWQPDSWQMIQSWMRTLSDALDAENISGFYKTRILNWMTWGDPDGPGQRKTDPDATMQFTAPGRTAGGGWVLSDDEAAEVLRASEARDETVYRALHPFAIEPDPAQPVFDDRGGEVEGFGVTTQVAHIGQTYPLIAACRCGRQIRQRAERGPWEHS